MTLNCYFQPSVKSSEFYFEHLKITNFTQIHAIKCSQQQPILTRTTNKSISQPCDRAALAATIETKNRPRSPLTVSLFPENFVIVGVVVFL